MYNQLKKNTNIHEYNYDKHICIPPDTCELCTYIWLNPISTFGELSTYIDTFDKYNHIGQILLLRPLVGQSTLIISFGDIIRVSLQNKTGSK